MRKSLLKSYVATIMVLAAALAAWSGNEFPLSEIGGWLAILMWTFAVGPQSVAFPRHRVQITAADCFLFYCLVVHGPMGGMAAAFVGTLGAIVLGDRRPNAQQAAFNLGAIPLSAGLAGVVFELLRADSSPFVAIIAAAAVFGIVNTLLVIVVLKLEGKTDVRQALLGPAAGFIASVFVTAILGHVLARVSTMGPGDWTAAGLVATCFLVGSVLTMWRDRSEDEVAA